MRDIFDTIVIGTGAGGLTVARGLVKIGKKVGVVERHKFGGDCTNVGCVPSKALLEYVRKNPKQGLQAALQYTRTLRQHFLNEEDEAALTKEGLSVIVGDASVVDAQTISVNGLQYGAKTIIIATGSKANTALIDSVPAEKIVTNEKFFEITDEVKQVVIVGGGYIGCEMAEATVRAGCSVTLLQRDEVLIPREEKESSVLIQKFLENLGVTVITQVTSMKGEGNLLQVAHAKGELKVPYDIILQALGRTPNVPDGLKEIGVEIDRGIKVDKYNQTAVKNILAIGDCVAQNPNFTHWANHEGRGVVRNMLAPFWKASVRLSPLPTVLFTEIEVARVGPTFEEAKKKYGAWNVATVSVPFSENDRTKLDPVTDAAEKPEGFVMLIFSKVYGTILGASIVGRHGGEMLPRLVAAVHHKETAYSLSSDIYAYPTRSEAIKRAADKFVFTTLREWKASLLHVIGLSRFFE